MVFRGKIEAGRYKKAFAWKRGHMFYKVKSVAPVSDFRLSVQFSEGITKIYDVKPLFDKLLVFRKLKEDPAQFTDVTVGVGGYGIVWGDDLDLS